jgi:hypothetical protein
LNRREGENLRPEAAFFLEWNGGHGSITEQETTEETEENSRFIYFALESLFLGLF